MARHRTKREEKMASKKNHLSFNGTTTTTWGWNKATLSLVVGIIICTSVVIYFAYSAPNAETLDQTRKSDDEWHQMKDKWSLEPLDDRAFDIVNNTVKIERLKNEYLRYLMVVRTPGSEGNIKVKNFLVKTMSNLGWDVEEDSFLESTPKSYSKDKVRFTNVIATLNPHANRRLVLACHFDSKVEPTGFLAATDSAVPCAMMLEIAKALDIYLKQIPKEMDLSLQFIFFDGEEAIKEWTRTDSIYGSRHLAQRWKDQRHPPGSNGDKNVLHSIDLFVLLDLLGEAGPNFYEMAQVKTRHFKELIRIEKRFPDCKNHFNKGIINSGVEDDHIPFLQRKVPILHVIPIPFPQNWHKITDNGENLDYNTINRLTRIFAVFVSEYLHLKPQAF